MRLEQMAATFSVHMAIPLRYRSNIIPDVIIKGFLGEINTEAGRLNKADDPL